MCDCNQSCDRGSRTLILTLSVLSLPSPIMAKFSTFADLDDVRENSDHQLPNPTLSDQEIDSAEELPPPRKMVRDRWPKVNSPEQGTWFFFNVFIPQMQLVNLYHIIRKQSGTHRETQTKDRNCYGRWFGHRRPGEEVRTVRVIGSGPSCASCEVNQHR